MRPSVDAPTTAWALLLLTADPWGVTGAVGGALAAAKTAAFALAVVLAYLGRGRGRWALRPAGWLLCGYAAVSVVGAQVAEIGFQESVIRAGRLVATVLAIAWIVSAIAWRRLALTLLIVATAQCALALFARPMSDGRLAGFLPPLHPNGIAALASISAVLTLTLWLRHEMAGRLAFVSIAVAAATLGLAQSRTSLVAVAIAAAVALLVGERRRSAVTVFTITCAAAGTALVASLANANLFGYATGSRLRWDPTFTGRTDGWDRVIQMRREWPFPAVGEGLSRKYVLDFSVAGRYRPVDGSWHAAYLEAGIIGLSLLAAAVLITVLFAAAWRPARSALPLLAYLLITSIFESILNDTSLLLVVFLGVAAVVAPPRQVRVRTGRGQHPPMPQPFGVGDIRWLVSTAAVAAGLAAAVVVILGGI